MAREKPHHIDAADRVGQRLREARLERKLSQRELSFPGCTSAYISRIEAGARVPSLQLLREFGRKLGVSADYLATGETDPPLAPLEEAELMLRLGEEEQARSLFERAVGGDFELDRARAQSGLGVIAYRNGRLDEAVQLFETARAAAGATWLEHAEAPELLIRSLALLGRLDEALEVAEAMARETPDTDTFALERSNVLLANALIDNGLLDRAADALSSAFDANGPLSDPLRLAQILWSQSRLHTARGQHDLAASAARRAIGVTEVTQHIAYTARTRHVLAYIENERGAPLQALETLDAGWDDAAQAGEPYVLALFRLERARALAKLGRTDEARDLARELVAETDELLSVEAAQTLVSLASVFVELGHPDEALGAYQAAANHLARVNTRLPSEAYKSWSEVLDQLGRRDEAFEVLRRAVDGLASRGTPDAQ